MKNFIPLVILMSVLFTSCQKEKSPFVTSFQLCFTDYFSGDTIPDVSFSVNGQMTGQYNFSAKTNAYGNFDTIFRHDLQTDFDLSPAAYQNYALATSGVVMGGTNTQAQLSLAFPGNIKFVTDCSGTGYIQNIQYHRLVPIDDSSVIESHAWAQPGSPGYMDCGYTVLVQVFPGDWVVTYDYKSSVSMPWSQLSDTVAVESDQTTTCTIVY